MLASIILGVIVIILNILDSYSTYLAMHKLPDEFKAVESNPAMNKLMSKSTLLYLIIKQGLGLCIVIFAILQNNPFALRFCCILMGLVVINNFYVYYSRKIKKKKILSPMANLFNFVKIPSKFQFWFAAPLLLFVSICIFYVSLLVGS
jgi:hypothetical protein